MGYNVTIPQLIPDSMDIRSYIVVFTLPSLLNNLNLKLVFYSYRGVSNNVKQMTDNNAGYGKALYEKGKDPTFSLDMDQAIQDCSFQAP